MQSETKRGLTVFPPTTKGFFSFLWFAGNQGAYWISELYALELADERLRGGLGSLDHLLSLEERRGCVERPRDSRQVSKRVHVLLTTVRVAVQAVSPNSVIGLTTQTPEVRFFPGARLEAVFLLACYSISLRKYPITRT